MDYNKLLIPVYSNCKQVATYQMVPLKEIYDKVKNNTELRHRTEAYRNALMLNLPASKLKKMKTETFPMLLPAVYCKDGRSAKDIMGWTNMCQADFDHMNPDCIDEAKRRLRELPFVAMYHTSMSGEGLHVYYVYLTPNAGLNPKTYEQAFRQGNELIAAAVNCDYDRAAEDPVHGSSICHDPDAWLNPEISPLKVDMKRNMGKRAKDDTIGNKKAVTQKDWPVEWTPERVYEMAKEMVEASAAGPFTHGNRNHYLVALAALLSDFGMDLETAQQLMEDEFAGQYGEEPIPSLVGGCYRTVAKMHGMKALPSKKKKKNGEKKCDVKILVSAEFIRRQCLRFDSVSRKIVKPDGSEITDRDINSMLLACNVETEHNISTQVFRAALMSDCIPEFNPLVDYLKPSDRKGQEASEPDMGVIERVADMVHVSFSPMECVGRSEEGGERSGNSPAPHSLWRTCFKKWFVAMVASWLKPEVVNHQMLVLIGRQGIFKSTWLDALIPPELARYRCRQSATNFSDKDELLRCAEFGLVNFDEFDRLTGRDLDNLKSLVTTPDVNVRAPYGTTKERRTRIASYCASGNKLQFLTDQTGNRRFLPFYVDSIDSPFDHKIPHRAMYDEAVWLIEQGNFDYWFTLDEIDRISGYVEQFADNPPEDELLDVYFDVPRTDSDNPETRQVTFLTPAEISAKLTTWGNLKKPISIRKLNVLMEKKGYVRIRNGRKGSRGYKVVELDSATIQSNRIISTGPAVF